MRAARPAAVAVNHEGVLADRKTESLGDRVLPLLDSRIHELLDPTAVETQDVIVVRPGIELEYRHAVGKMVARHETRRLELREYPVNRGETDVLAQVDETTVDVLGRQMSVAAMLENLEDFDAGQRHLESRFPQIVAFHDDARSFG